MISQTKEAWEQWSLDEFFLEPGSRRGYVNSIEVTDEHVVTFCDSDDISAAAHDFSQSLGTRSEVCGLLSGTAPLSMLRFRRPSFVRLLVFVCWAQVTGLRQEKEFRRLLSDRLGYEAPDTLTGLARMFERLQEWLKSEWDIDLRLSAGVYSQIGYALHIAFPTWRDLNTLRNVRDKLRAAQLAHPQSIVSAIAQARRDESSLAFSARLNEWRNALQTGDPFADELALPKAWRRVVAEDTPTDRIRVSEDEFGDLRLAIVREDERETQIYLFEEDILKVLDPEIARCAKRGWIYLASSGLGRWTSSDKNAADSLLLSPQGLEKISSQRPDIPCRPVGRTGWLLMAIDRTQARIELVNEKQPSLQMVDGVRSGGAFIGRWPLTPRIAAANPAELTLTLDSVPLPAVTRDKTISLAAGSILNGRVHILRNGQSIRGFRLKADADEHSPMYLKTVQDGMVDPEDGPLFNTQPQGGRSATREYEGHREPPCDRLRALEEAVYAKSARRLPMQQFAVLAARAIDGDVDAPSFWDVLRAFVDAGSLEPCLAKKAAARLFVPRPTCLRSVELPTKSLLVLEGLAAEGLRERLSRSAQAIGLQVEQYAGISCWSLPLLAIVAGHREAVELEKRTKIPLHTGPEATSPPSARWASVPDSIGYVTTSTWSDTAQRFEGGCCSESPTTLSRLDRPAGDRPSLYEVKFHGRTELFGSPAIALLRHATASGTGQGPFRRSQGLMLRIGKRVHLPAAWGRWLRYASLASPGPVRTEAGWTYGYPANPAAVAALAALCRVERPAPTPPWAQHLAASRRTDLPSFVVRGAIVRPSLGRSR